VAERASSSQRYITWTSTHKPATGWTSIPTLAEARTHAIDGAGAHALRDDNADAGARSRIQPTPDEVALANALRDNASLGQALVDFDGHRRGDGRPDAAADERADAVADV
jgi:hypothetical protein